MARVQLVIPLISCLLFQLSCGQETSQLNLPMLLAQLFGFGPSPETTQACGGRMSLLPGSPIFLEPPTSGSSGVRCTWQLKAPQSFKIKLNFEEFRVVCPENYLFISAKGKEGKRYCDTTPSPVVTNGNELRIRFVSNPRFGDAWFRIRAEAVEARVEVINAEIQTKSLSSPNYPLDYPSNHVQGWLIKSPDDGFVVVDCRDGFRLERSDGGLCRRDFLLVSQSGDRRFTDGRRFCGEDAPGLLISNSSIALLFHSDNENTFSGFKCFYQSVKSAKPKPSVAPPVSKPDLTPSLEKCHCGQANLGKRVVGGVMTEIHEYPWQAGISTRTGYLFCGGTLINDMYVVTAAHCTRGRSATSLLVLLGEHDTSTDAEAQTLKMDVSNIIRHPNYDTVTNNNDIALLKLKRKIRFDHRMKPPCFTRPGVQYTGENVVITGWGAIKEGGKVTGILHEVSIPVLHLDKCVTAYGRDMITNNMLCAGLPEGGKDSCQGDSGGPMVWEHNNRWHLIGIVSWGYGCARPNAPGVYTRVDKYLKWIDQNTRDSTYC